MTAATIAAEVSCTWLATGKEWEIEAFDRSGDLLNSVTIQRSKNTSKRKLVTDALSSLGVVAAWNMRYSWCAQ
jgi:hypothetical protein